MEVKLSLIKKMLGSPFNTLSEIIKRNSIAGTEKVWCNANNELAAWGMPYFNIFSKVAPGYWTDNSSSVVFRLKTPLKMSSFSGYNHNAIAPNCNTLDTIIFPIGGGNATLILGVNFKEMTICGVNTHIKAKIWKFSSVAYPIGSIMDGQNHLMEIPLTNVKVSTAEILEVVFCNADGGEEMPLPVTRFPLFQRIIQFKMKEGSLPIVDYSIKLSDDVIMGLNNLFFSDSTGKELYGEETIAIGTNRISVMVTAYKVSEYSYVDFSIDMYRNGVYDNSRYINLLSENYISDANFILDPPAMANEVFSFCTANGSMG